MNMTPALYQVENIPVFQNKVYPSADAAKKAATGTVVLQRSPKTGIVCNAAFDPALMVYDEHYQNEQNHSAYFQEYLEGVAQKVASFGIAGKKVVEIGCGKGYFLEMLRNRGLNVTGFDPTYEGDSPYIVKDYFSEKYQGLQADFLIMRHTMEHIPNPFDFLHEIARANQYQGSVFIEVPTLDWILEKNAFWDIFYEHCNYFTESAFANLFHQAETGRLFQGQYMYIHAKLEDLKKDLVPYPAPAGEGYYFADQMRYWDEFLRQHPDTVIWGAGAKGSTFLNLLDPQATRVKYVVDVNPRKQNQFIARTGHRIVPPEHIDSAVKTILVMNENYLGEIKESMAHRGHFQFYTL